MNTAETFAYFPVSALVRSPHNMRQPPLTKKAKAQRKRDIESLAASIMAQGVLQTLVVHPMMGDETKWGVAAGDTRRESVELLIKRKKWPAERPLYCKVVSEVEAVNASLSENIQRTPTHPADEYDAFAKLRAANHSVEQIAAQYGISTQLVERRLALADVSPRFMQMYRKEEIELDVMMAFTLTTDHLWQEEIWNKLPKHYRHASAIRAALTKEELPATHKIAKFITIRAYEDAGGVVRRDLFAEDESGHFLADRALVFQLAQAKLDAAAEEVRAEGFAWVIAVPELQHSQRNEYETVPMMKRKPTKKEQKQINSLNAEITKLDKQLQAIEEAEDFDDEKFDTVNEQRDTLDQQLDALNETLEEPNPAFASVLGAVLHVNHRGELEVERSLVKKSDRAKLAKIKAENPADAEASEGATDLDKVPGFSERLNRTLSGHVNAALQVSLLQQPRLALATLAYSMAGDVLYRSHVTPVAHVTTRTQRLTDFIPEDAAALKEYNVQVEQLRTQLPEVLTLDWLCGQSESLLLSIITASVAASVYVVTASTALNDNALTLAKHAQLDMRQWWVATPDTVFNHVPKTVLAQIVTELGRDEVADPILKSKKTDSVVIAQSACEAMGGWWPSVMKFE